MPTAQLTAEEIDRRVRAAEPAARLAPPRILRRVIKAHRRLGGLGLRVPHRKSYILDRESLLKIASPGELGFPADGLPEVVQLYPRPEPADSLRDYWRLLFHSGVHAALRARRLDAAAVAERVRALGPVVFDEARAVLRQEQMLFDPADDAEVYEEFAAVFLELRHFDAKRLPHTFPAVEDFDAAAALLGRDADAEAILRRTRPEGAADADAPPAPPPPEPDGDGEKVSPEKAAARAGDASSRGNQVRAALVWLRAGQTETARSEIDKLAERLQKAIRFPERDRDAWASGLAALAGRAAGGFWNQEMRLLSDLQKACLDNERSLYAADFVEFFVSWFRRPLKRPLPDLPLVRTVLHLRRAVHRLTMARVPAEERERLGELLSTSLAAAELRLRDNFRPQLAGAFDKVGLVPATVAERLAREKLVEELLDGVVKNGFLALGDLRDALARNRLKLPDLRSPVEVVTGDPLIRLNRELAYDLDGVYRRGEIYRRWLQRLSSVFFGNPAGRLVTLYVALPLLGSLFLLKGVEGIVDEVHHLVLTPLLSLEQHEETPAPAADDVTGQKPPREPVAPLFNYYSFAGLAVFLLLVLHVQAFRDGVYWALWYLWRVVRGLLYDSPYALFHLPPVLALLRSRAFLLFYQFLGKPLLWTLPVALVLRVARVDWPTLLGVSAATCFLVSIVLNTRLGLVVEETTSDWLSRTWQLIRDDLVPGLFRWFGWLGQRLSERIDKVRYTVEEWLLFRQGQSKVVFWLKLMLGLPWFVVSYVVRFVLMVLVEPQINPIKHFPVVTVSHKLMLVIAPPIATTLAPVIGWKVPETYALVTIVFSLIPGLFGFLAWELKENWKLYRANQSPTLNPEMVGGHGEYVVNFVRPGFHSGTLPKLYARLRRASGAKARKAEEGLHHVEQELHHFVERELVTPLAASKGWHSAATVAVGHVQLATNEIRVELCCPGLGPENCWLNFILRDGKLVGRLDGPGWLAKAGDAPRAAFVNVLAGLYKRAGVELVEPSPGAEPVEFAHPPIAWEAWVAFWQLDAEGKPPRPLMPGVMVL